MHTFLLICRHFRDLVSSFLQCLVIAKPEDPKERTTELVRKLTETYRQILNRRLGLFYNS